MLTETEPTAARWQETTDCRVTSFEQALARLAEVEAERDRWAERVKELERRARTAVSTLEGGPIYPYPARDIVSAEQVARLAAAGCMIVVASEWQARGATPIEALADRSEREAALEAERVDAMREAADLLVEVLEGRGCTHEPLELVPALDRVEKLRIELAEAAKGAKQVDAELLMMAEAHEQLRKDNAQLRGIATDQASSAIRAWHGITRIASALGMETVGGVEVDAVVSKADEAKAMADFDELTPVSEALGLPGHTSSEEVVAHAAQLRKNFDGAIADLRETEREREQLRTRNEQLRADVETLAHKLASAEDDLRSTEHDLARLIKGLRRGDSGLALLDLAGQITDRGAPGWLERALSDETAEAVRQERETWKAREAELVGVITAVAAHVSGSDVPPGETEHVITVIAGLVRETIGSLTSQRNHTIRERDDVRSALTRIASDLGIDGALSGEVVAHVKSLKESAEHFERLFRQREDERAKAVVRVRAMHRRAQRAEGRAARLERSVAKRDAKIAEQRKALDAIGEEAACFPGTKVNVVAESAREAIESGDAAKQALMFIAGTVGLDSDAPAADIIAAVELLARNEGPDGDVEALRAEVARLREVIGFWERSSLPGLLGISDGQMRTVRGVLRQADRVSDQLHAPPEIREWVEAGRPLLSEGAA